MKNEIKKPKLSTNSRTLHILLEKMTLVFFDTETTGLPRDYNAPSSKLDNWPRLVQLAWIVSDYDGNIISSENHIISPDGFEIPPSSAAIHGITTSIAKSKGKKLIDVIDKFLGVLQNATAIAGHNITFDQHIVETEIFRCGRPNILKSTPAYCTMKMSANYCNILNSNKEVKWPTLQELFFKLYGKKFEGAHNAMADINATYRCFFSLVKLGVIKLEKECVDYYRGWKVTNKRLFTDEEKNVVKKAFVTQTNAGYSIKFLLNDWSEVYIPVDKKSNVSICEIIDLENAMLLTLSKPGHDDIYRVHPKQGDAKSTKYETTSSSLYEYSDYNIGFSRDGYIMLRYNDALDVEEYAIPEGCKVLADSCFSLYDPYGPWENPHFSSLIIPDSLEIIGDFAFGGCAELESLHIPASVKHIQGNPFPSMLPITTDSPLYVVKDDVLYDKDYARLIHAFSLSKTIIIEPSVRKIEHGSLRGCDNLSNIIVHSEINEIGKDAFAYCKNLKTVIINAKMEFIPDGLFRGSGIYEFDIPTETKKIGFGSFADCKRLQKVNIPENVTKIDAFAFENDESLKYVTINANIQEIEQRTFRGCSSLKEIIIPEGVKSIRTEAFFICTSLETINLPYSIEELGDAAFFICTNLKRIELPRGIKGLSRKLFHGCKALREVIMPSTIEYIGSEVFEGCESLYSIVIPVGVKRIGNEAFYYCGLREAIIPDTVTELGEYAFCGCRNLHSALIPGSIKTIPNHCFHGCRSLSQITICEGVESIEDAFMECPSLKKLFLPEGMKKFGCTLQSSLINDLYVPSTLENIVPFNRGYGSGYVNLHIPFGMKMIAEKYIEDTKKRFEESGYDFDEPFEIYEYTIIDNLIVEVLDKSKNTLVIKGLLNLYVPNDIVIPSSALIKGRYYRIVRIGTNAFYNVTSLNSIKIFDGISSIGAHAFSYCSSLKKVEFPASLTDIEGELFYNCNKLESIFVDFDNPKFLSVNGVLYTKDHKKIVAYPNANGKDYKIIEGTEYIESFAFKSCVDLENLRLPKSIRAIGDNVFYGCDKLKNIIIPDGLEKISILQERTKTRVKYKNVDYTITQLINLIYKET